MVTADMTVAAMTVAGMTVAGITRGGGAVDRAEVAGLSFPELVGRVEAEGAGGAGGAAVALYRAWIDGQGAGGPHVFLAWFNLGVVLAEAGDLAGAEAAYLACLALRPDFWSAAVNLGLCLEGLCAREAALAAWEGALQPDGARTALLNQQARLLEESGRLEAAEAALRRSLLTDPRQPDAVQHWVHVRQKGCCWPVLSRDVPGLPVETLVRQSGPLGVLALTDDVREQRAVAAGWITRKMPAAPERLSPAEGYGHGKIRVGYLSSDFCRHAMSYLIAELFERHDRSRFEVFGYCSTVDDGSEIRRRVLAAFDHCRSVRLLSDEALARLIRADEIDVLIDLNGLTAGSRLAALRWRPAPVQATYLGFIGPVPLPELDYLLCDDFVVPPFLRGAYRPAPLAVGPLYQANDRRRMIGPVVSRAEVGLPEDGFVLCCFSKHYKITEAMFGAWLAVLLRAPRAVLWLAEDNPWSAVNLRAAAMRAGIGAERLLFAPRTSPEAYLPRLALADLFLDTFPYNAGTVASDALRMEVPLVTLAGRSFASRMAGSLLAAIGAAEGIASDVAGYVALATRLATDRAVYQAYRSRFTRSAWEAGVGDTAGFTAAFEATLERVVTRSRLAA